MEILGYALALLMGLILGLIGAGGSILTVPILVYFFNIKPIVATGYSLLIVGSTALYASLYYWKRGLISLQTLVTFSLPSMLFILLTRTYLVPNLPAAVCGIPKDTLMMLLFAILMVIASVFMFLSTPDRSKRQLKKDYIYYINVLIASTSVGLLTGLVGAGGGFLIIPSLILLFGLDVKQAVGTSLAIIAINSLIGVNGDIHAGIVFDWLLLMVFLSFTLVGSIIGLYITKHVSAPDLKKIFSGCILLVSFFIFTQEIYTLVRA